MFKIYFLKKSEAHETEQLNVLISVFKKEVNK